MATQEELAKKAFDMLNARDTYTRRMYRGVVQATDAKNMASSPGGLSHRGLRQPKCAVCGGPAQLFGLVGGPRCMSDKCVEVPK